MAAAADNYKLTLFHPTQFGEKELKAGVYKLRVDDNHIADLHIWSIGPGIYSASLTVVSNTPRPPEHYKALIPTDLGIVHTVVEVHRLPP